MHIIMFAFWENTNSQHFVVLQSAHHTTFNMTCIIIPFIFKLFLHTYASLANFFFSAHIYYYSLLHAKSNCILYIGSSQIAMFFQATSSHFMTYTKC
jgi:hypothetical protein